MTELEKRILSDLSSGNFHYSTHGVQRSNSRQVARADIQRAAQDYLDIWTEEGGEVVHVIGPDWNEEEIEIRAADDGGTVIITVVDAS